METLDLHGIRHQKARTMAEDFVVSHNMPVKIITGNSPNMQKIVKELAKQYNLKWEFESDWNLGAIILT
jgi:hypothetical protein